MSQLKNIFIVAGEPSGDQHAANYLRSHRAVNPNITFTAIGQQELKDAGANIIYNSEEIAVVGLVEVIQKYAKIKKALNVAYKHITTNKPDLIILVDYVEFNLKIAKFAKQKGIQVLFYVAPQVWAWREGRIKNIINVVDHLAVVFPFEQKLFKKYTNNVTYVGHPLADDDKYKTYKLEYLYKTTHIGIFPGSRESEIKNNLHIMLDCIRLNDQTLNKDRNIRIFYANKTAKKTILKLLPQDWHNLLVDGKNIDEIKKCRKVITASGTVTLELTLLNIPMIIMYRLSPLTYMIMKFLIKIPYIGLVNLVLGESLGSKPIVKEFIQPSYSDQVDAMVELQKIDRDETYRASIEEGYSRIRDTLKPGAAKNVTAIAEKMIS